MSISKKTTDISHYNVGNYQPKRGFVIRGLWFLVNILFFKSYIFPFYGFKRFLLRLFGAKVEKGVIIKPNVNIKYPWLLSIGSYTWIGESSWIDNLVQVQIGAHVCISQGALLLTGNHNYKKVTFDLIPGEIILENGVWIGAKSVVCPGVRCFSHSVLSVGSVAVKNMEAYHVYQGNPATKVRKRLIKE